MGTDGTKGLVLLVDDEPSVRGAIANLLRPLGYAVEEAASGVEALGVLQDRGGISLVITDNGMPNMTGIDLARCIRAAHPDIPVVMLTADLLRDVERPARAAGVRLVLEKPIDLEELRSALDRLTSG